MTELKPCPFCGGEAHIKSYVDIYGEHYSVGCSDSECAGFETLYCKDTPEEAIADWNRRAERTCHMDDDGCRDTCIVNHAMSNGDYMSMEFGYKRCSCCGAHVFDCPTLRYCPGCGAKVVDR